MCRHRRRSGPAGFIGAHWPRAASLTSDGGLPAPPAQTSRRTGWRIGRPGEDGRQFFYPAGDRFPTPDANASVARTYGCPAPHGMHGMEHLLGVVETKRQLLIVA
jgi:hypothetical protein